ncbi:MAG: T9SS type A sorting domain-containing protein [Saprospiraceae bacterium]
MKYKIHPWIFLLFFCFFGYQSFGQKSVARVWNEMLLQSISKDYARPVVHARNLFYHSALMYDIWAAYQDISKPYFLGNFHHDYYFYYDETAVNDATDIDINTAISYASYRFLKYKFAKSPGKSILFPKYDSLMYLMGFDTLFTDMDYQSGDPRAFGNYVAQLLLDYNLQDGSNEANDYTNTYYKPLNPPLIIKLSGNANVTDLNRWQPIAFDAFVDQSGNILPNSTPEFLGAEWGNVYPFSLNDSDKTTLLRDSTSWNVYHLLPPPPYIEEPTNAAFSPFQNFYKWGFGLVTHWGSHLDPNDPLVWDISPKTQGNAVDIPQNYTEYPSYYNFETGGVKVKGRPMNPVTGQPYTAQMVKRGDYTRVLAEYWADGPESETPPGHWFSLFNYAMDQSHFKRLYKGEGIALSPLEWDVKSYFALGGAMHDVAIAAWSNKGYYDYVRPVTALRGMAELGQSSQPLNFFYNPKGLPLIPGKIEYITPDDPLVGEDEEYTWQLKVKSWKGYHYIHDVTKEVAGVGWIRAAEWYPYQRLNFVTPPFAGYVSGHSTFSRAASDVLTYITGSPYFPDGVGEFVAKKDKFLRHELGPSEDVILQWATYRDAADQCSLSRIWGGIHPPCDDLPGRQLGSAVAEKVIPYAEDFIFPDNDGDGFRSYADCNDFDPAINPNATEIAGNDVDENCDGNLDVSGTYDNQAVASLRVYPNPAQDYIMVSTSEPGKINIRIFDDLGKIYPCTVTNNLTDGIVKINIANLPRQIYTISLYSNDIIKSKRFVKM